MKNKPYKKLFALTLTLLVALALTACVPEIHIHTGDSSSETATTDENVQPEETPQKEESKTEITSETKADTSVASSEETKVESSKKEESTTSKTPAKDSSSKKETSSKVTSSKKETSSKESSTDKISKSKAESIALKDAGLKASQVYDFESELDYDKGTLRYEISFEYEGRDYDYEIDAKTGKIISVEKPNATASAAKISKSKAKKH